MVAERYEMGWRARQRRHARAHTVPVFPGAIAMLIDWPSTAMRAEFCGATNYNADL
jgi:hypothetical protein